MSAALTRFRVMAYVVGVLLLVLVFVAMPLKYFADQPTMVAIVGPLHGFLYMVYLVTAFDLAVRAKWPFLRTLLVLLAGTVPVMSFVAERKATHWVRDATLASV
jgi:integral membrane protein